MTARHRSAASMPARVPTPGASARRWTVSTVQRLARQPGMHRDPESRGLALRVRGTHVAWVLRYRHNGTPRIWTIGRYPDLGLADARSLADAGRTRIANGEDPASDRRTERERAARERQNSIEALAQAYIEQHAKPRKRGWRDDESKLRCEVLPAWKGRPVSDITRRDCRELVQAIHDRGAPIYANRVAALLSRLFRFAVDEEWIETNPAQRLPKPGVEASERPKGEQEDKPYTDEEIRQIWQQTEALDAAPRALYRLGLITGQRPGEISGMRWDELAGQWWTIPASRTKNKREHRVFLTPLALEQLAAVPRVEDEPRVFAGYRGKRQLAELNRRVFEGIRERQKPRHAMRDTASTGMAAAGVSVDDVSRVLNHAVGLRVTGVYNAYAYDREKRLALTKWERRLRAILEGKTLSKVVAITVAK